MKRDMDLVYRLLADIEVKPNYDGLTDQLVSKASDFGIKPSEQVAHEVFRFHLVLLIRNGFIDGDHTSGNFVIKSLSWKGYDLLDRLRGEDNGDRYGDHYGDHRLWNF